MTEQELTDFKEDIELLKLAIKLEDDTDIKERLMLELKDLEELLGD